jgi:hypothetical protein
MGPDLLINDEFVAVFPALIRATGSASRAIVLQTLWFARDRATGTTTMTIAEVADRTGLSHRTVERATTWARGVGALTRSKVGAYDHTSVWTVMPSVLATLTESNPPNGENDLANVAGSDFAKVAGSTVLENVEELFPPLTPPVTEGRQPSPEPTAPEPKMGETFAAFWAEYPRKVGKEQARKSYERHARQVGHAVIMAGLEAANDEWRRKRTRREYIPHPATWLNRAGWEDEHDDAVGNDDRAAFARTWQPGGGGFFGPEPTNGVAR